jgi:peptide chain release factor 1
MNVIEIRAGTGGDEASILQGICSVCIPNIVKSRLENSVVDMNEGTSGGFKEVIFEV